MDRFYLKPKRHGLIHTFSDSASEEPHLQLIGFLSSGRVVATYFLIPNKHNQLSTTTLQVGFEPTTLRLTAVCSTVELLKNGNTGYYSLTSTHLWG